MNYDSDEIVMVIDNDQGLYNEKIEVFEKLTKFMKAGKYKSSSAEKAFAPIIKQVDTLYRKKFDTKFTSKDLKQAAKEFVEEFEDAYKNQEYDFMEESVSEAKKVDNDVWIDSFEAAGRTFFQAYTKIDGKTYKSSEHSDKKRIQKQAANLRKGLKASAGMVDLKGWKLVESVNEAKLRRVKVTYDTGDTTTTSMAAGLSDEDIKDYFKIGKRFNVGTYPKETMAKVKKVEILESVNEAKDDLVDIGWAIETSSEDDILYNVSEDADDSWVKKGWVEQDGSTYPLTKKGWQQINKDISKIESNGQKWLKKTFDDARNEGHDGNDALVGTVWVDPSNKKHRRELDGESSGNNATIFTTSSGSLDSAFQKGLSDIGEASINITLEFFSDDIEDIIDGDYVVESVNEAKSIELPGTLFELVGFGKDSNGNSVVKLKNKRGKGFSIQTNGNLPKTHKLKTSGYKAKDLEPEELKAVAKEVKGYVDSHGTKVMKESVNEAAFDEHSVRELVLYADNTYKLYKIKVAAFENLSKKKKKGNYDSKLAPKIFKRFVDEAAKAYDKDFSLQGQKAFSVADRKQAQIEFAEEFEEAWENKEYDFMEESVQAPQRNPLMERMQQFAGIQVNRETKSLNEGEWGFDKAGFDGVEEWKVFIKKWGFPNKPKTAHIDFDDMLKARKEGNTDKPDFMGFYWENKKGDMLIAQRDPMTGKPYKGSGSSEKGYMHYIGIEGPNAKKIASDLKDYESFFYDDESKNNRDFI